MRPPPKTQPATRNFFRFSFGVRMRVCVPYIYKIKIKKIISYIGLRCTRPRRVGGIPHVKTETQPGCGLRFMWVKLPVSTFGRTDALDEAVESKVTIFSLLFSESVLCMWGICNLQPATFIKNKFLKRSVNILNKGATSAPFLYRPLIHFFPFGDSANTQNAPTITAQIQKNVAIISIDVILFPKVKRFLCVQNIL